MSLPALLECRNRGSLLLFDFEHDIEIKRLACIDLNDYGDVQTIHEVKILHLLP